MASNFIDRILRHKMGVMQNLIKAANSLPRQDPAETSSDHASPGSSFPRSARLARACLVFFAAMPLTFHAPQAQAERARTNLE